MIISSCWCSQCTEQSCHKPQHLSGEGREMPGLQNSFTLIILYKVSSGNILAHLHLRKSIKTLYVINFCFSNFPFFVYSLNSSVFAIELPPRQSCRFISQQAVEARALQHQPTPTGQSRRCLTSSLQGDSRAAHFILREVVQRHRTFIWCCYHSNGREAKVTAAPR